MLHRMCAVVASSLLVAGALVGPAAAGTTATAAGTKKVKITVKCKAQGQTKIVGTSTGQPLGKAKVTGTLALPNATLTFTTKKGSATMAASGRVADGGKLAGSWQWVRGTGAYKGITGKGTSSGDLGCQPWLLKGTASY
jgi:hypothetical protein